MAKIDIYFKQLLEQIQEMGFKYMDTTRDIECQQINSASFQIDMKEFPLLTIKEMFWKGIVTELIWFLRGDKNIKFLRDNGVHIWDKDAYQYYVKQCLRLDAKPLPKDDYMLLVDRGLHTTISGNNGSAIIECGTVGENYGVQWRNYKGPSSVEDGPNYDTLDQIENLFSNLKERPINRRNIITAWNPTAVYESDTSIFSTALPPCHWAWEILPRPLYAHERLEILLQQGVLKLEENDEQPDNDTIHEIADKNNIPNYAFDLKWHQRSVDTFLG